MKSRFIYIIGAAALIPFASAAQTDAADSVGAAAPQALYNTPSESYKAERNFIRKGNSLFESGDFHKALEAYDKALEVNSGSIRARYNKARTLLELQTEDNKGTQADPRVQAVEILNGLLADAAAYDKEVAERAYYNLGNAAFNDQQYDQSIALYKSALRLSPDNQQTRENLRLAQLQKQQQEQNQDQQEDKQDQQQQDQQQQQQDQQQQQQQQQQQEQPMTQSAQQILQSMQNKENATRRKVQQKEAPAAGRPQSDKPW